MTTQPITIATWDYDRVRALMDGRVKVDGCEVRHINLPPEECFPRAWAGEFDVAEIGFSNYLISLARGNSPFIAIPVFTSRAFRHSAIYIRDDRGIDKPADLKGKRVGVPQYEMAAALWVRGMLKDDYGVLPEDMSWHQGGLDRPGHRPPFALKLPERIKLSPLPEGKTLSQMLIDGELDGIVTARAPSCFDAGHPRVRRLFADYRAAEIGYFQRHRVFPIMHVVGIRRTVAEKLPWLPGRLVKAFGEAKRIADADLGEITAFKVGLPWVTAELQATETLMGRDFWPYGVDANRKTLETAARYSVEQGITSRAIAVEEMFAPTTVHGAPV